jgi:hypothetical protein
MNMNLWKCTNFVRFCVSFWKIVTISNHTKTFNIFKFNFLYYKLQKKIKQHKNCITSTFLKELMNFFKPLNFDKHKSEKIWKYACFLDVFNGTLLLWKTEDQRNFIMKTKRPLVKVVLFNEIINLFKPNFDIEIFFESFKFFFTIHIIWYNNSTTVIYEFLDICVSECIRVEEKYYSLQSILHALWWTNCNSSLVCDDNLLVITLSK